MTGRFRRCLLTVIVEAYNNYACVQSCTIKENDVIEKVARQQVFQF